MRRVFLLAVAWCLLAAACGSGGSPSSVACSDPSQEPLDPASGLHVLTADDVSLDDLTPTSGPHLPAGGPLGLSDVSLPQAQQLAILERGSVLISVDADDTPLLREIAELFAEDTVLHPVDGLETPIVATAWRTRITCESLDEAYLRWFIDDRTGRFAQDH